MRILEICTRFPPGGIQRHVLDLTDWLRRQGHEVYVAGSPGAWLDETKDRQFWPVNISDVAADGGSTARRLWRAGLSALDLRRRLLAERVEIIHAHESAPVLVSKLACLGLPIPIVVTYHGSEPERVREFAQIAKRCADQIVTPSRKSAEDLIAQGRAPADRIKVIGLGLRKPPALDPLRRAAVRNTLVGGKDDVLVTTIARLSHQKGIDQLIEVAKQTLDRHSNVRFAVVGDGPLRNEAHAWAKSAGVDGRVAFLGASDRPYDILQASDIFMLTSRWESLPITIVEAFQCGLPVLATDAGGVAELVDDEVGRVIPLGDMRAMADALCALIGDPSLRARLGQAAKRRAGEQRFDPAWINGRIEDLYEDLTGCPALMRREWA